MSLLDTAAVGGWAPDDAAAVSSGPAESAGSGVQGDPATATAAAHESPSDEQLGTAASPLARSHCASTTTGGTISSAPSGTAAAVAQAERELEPGSALRHLRADAQALTREYHAHPERFK